MTILQTILDEKIVEVAKLVKQPIQKTMDLPIYSLYERLKGQQHLQVISEIKRASPSKGMINDHVNPVEQAKRYEEAGAACISVLTDAKFFKGSFADLQAVAQTVKIPVLCKDFIIDPIQIDYARAHGASVILLIVAALDEATLQSLFNYAKSQLLDVLVEVHTVEEYDIAKKLGAKIIGVNNRNLKTFEVDLANTAEIAAQFSAEHEQVLVSESGIKNAADAKFVAEQGANAILVGETLMLATNIEETLLELQVERAMV